MVSNLSILNTDDFFSPVAAKSMSVFLSITSLAYRFSVIEEINAMITSLCCGSAEMRTAGRTFVLDRSVKGKGTRTMSPRLREPVLEIIAVREGINVFARVVEKVERFAFLRRLGDKQSGDIAIANHHGNKYLLMFGQIQRDIRFDPAVFIYGG